MSIEVEGKASLEDIPEWTLHVDESSTQKISRAGIVLTTLHRIPLSSVMHFSFKVLLVGLYLSKALGVQKLKTFNDLQLIVSQVFRDFQACERNMSAYLQKVEELLGYFTKYKLEQITRELNENVDALARLTLAINFQLDRLISIELLNELSTNVTRQILTIQSDNTWMIPIVKYLKGNCLPNNQLEAQRVKAMAAQYLIEGNLLYKKGYERPLLRCLILGKSHKVLKDIR